jgi:Ser/Thr protein kinase RdoA (MazF antagonist)
MSDKPFAELTYRGQVRRLRQLAEKALAAYELGDARFELLNCWNNTTFRVDTATERYVLRINRPGFQDTPAIRSELIWLTALKQEANLNVPEPVPNKDGELLTTVSVAVVPQPRDCVLFRWLNGQFLEKRLNAKSLQLAGVFLAKMHQHAQRFVLPTGFTRKKWDFDLFMGGEPGIDKSRFDALLSSEERRVFEVMAGRIERELETLGEAPEVFGLIHADFHHGNYLFYKGELYAIDFDECGFGHYVYDVAVALSEIRHREEFPVMREAFLEGYRQIRRFPESLEEHIESLIIARLLMLAIWQAGISGSSPQHQEVAAEFARDIISETQDFLNR